MIDLFNETKDRALQNETMFCLGVLSLFLSVYVVKYAGVVAGLLYGVFMVSGLRVATIGISPYQYDLNRFYMAQILSVRSMLTVSLIVFTAIHCNKLIRIFPWICIADSVLILIYGRGAFYNDSMDGCFIACTLPLLLKNDFKWKWMMFLPVLGIAKSHSVTAGLAVMLSLLLLASSMQQRCAVILSSLLCAWLLPFHHGLTQTNGRIELWGKVITFWKENHTDYGADLLGFGPSSYTLFEPVISVWDKPQGPTVVRWVYAHNEYIQAWFENGYIGFSLFIVLVLLSTWRLRRIPWAFSSAASTAFCIASQPILRNVIGSMFAAVLVRISYNRGAPHD